MTPRLANGRFYGRTLRRRRSGSVTVAETVFAAGAEIPAHSHERPIFNFVLDGAYTERWDGRTTECGASELLFHPAGLVHSERFPHGTARCLTLEFDPLLEGHAPGDSLPDDGNLVLPQARWSWVATRLRRELGQWDDLSPSVVQGLLGVLLAESTRWRTRAIEGEPPRFVRRARELLHDRFRDGPRIGDVAGEVGVRPSSLARAFRRCYDCTPGEYVRRLRIEYARRRLANSSGTLAAVAVEAGFSDQSHLHREFMRATGMTPAEYRAATG